MTKAGIAFLWYKRGHWQPRIPSNKARHALQQANSIYNLPSINQAIKWMHALCGYPVKTTWSKAAKAGNFVGWPLLTGKNINKYYPDVKGHMNQQQKNVRSTKTPFQVCHAAAALRGKKMKDIFVSTYDTHKTSFSDQTGQFPKQSKCGYKYIMVLVEIDSNAILVEPMKSRKDAEMIRAYNVLVKRLQQANIHPRKHVLDNKISENMKQHIKKNLYGLPQAGLLANELLEQRLNKHGYFQSKLVPGLWKHTPRPIFFTLIIDDFGIKYIGKEHVEHLMTVLQEHYQIKAD